MADTTTPTGQGGRCGSHDLKSGNRESTSLPSFSQLRRRLPDRRNSEIIVLEYEGRRYRASVSRFADGAIGEIFIDAAKYGSEIAVHANEAAILASLALQLGATVDDLRHSIRGPLATALGMFEVPV